MRGDGDDQPSWPPFTSGRRAESDRRHLQYNGGGRSGLGESTLVSARFDRLDLAVGRADVAGPGAHQAVVVELLDDVGRPAGDAGHGEDRRVEVDLQAHVVIEPGARPVDVRAAGSSGR